MKYRNEYIVNKTKFIGENFLSRRVCSTRKHCKIL